MTENRRRGPNPRTVSPVLIRTPLSLSSIRPPLKRAIRRLSFHRVSEVPSKPLEPSRGFLRRIVHPCGIQTHQPFLNLLLALVALSTIHGIKWDCQLHQHVTGLPRIKITFTNKRRYPHTTTPQEARLLFERIQHHPTKVLLLPRSAPRTTPLRYSGTETQREISLLQESVPRTHGDLSPI
jgi:hypothetical protein